MKPKIILGIETSCDETACAILQKQGYRITILSNVVASSASLQSKYGGIIPEQAAREQIKSIIPVIIEALEQAQITPQDLDAIAITQGPGLIGSLLVGVETARVLSLVWEKPLIPVNHLIGHFYANWIARGDSEEGSQNVPQRVKRARNGFEIPSQQDPVKSTLPSFPCIGLLVSGGHTDLVLFKNHGKFKYLGGTRDDAAGECFDKCARLLGLPYPGGPQISRLAQSGNPKAFNLPRPMIDSANFDFSFSGLKTAVSNLTNSLGSEAMFGESLHLSERSEFEDRAQTSERPSQVLFDLCASIEQAIIDPLIKKTIKAAQKHKVEQIIVAGGVAANKRLVAQLTNLAQKDNIEVISPPPFLCTDNAAMIASAAFFQKPTTDHLNLQADPNLSLAY